MLGLALGLLLRINPALGQDLTFPQNFVFGVATAPAQTEDQLNDIWEDWGRSGKIRAYQNEPLPELRNQSWTQPNPDLALLFQLNIQAVRLGVDWGRVMPSPTHFDETAIQRYKSIIRILKQHHIKIMLTLSHHSVPKWVQLNRGWQNPKTGEDFLRFSKRMIQEFHQDVDWWITFNEPQVFSILAYQQGIWPPGEKNSLSSLLDLPFYEGVVIKSLQTMIKAHQEIYDYAHHEFNPIQVGIAQHVGFHRGATFLGKLITRVSGRFMNWYFLDAIRQKMDFTGLNYYGAEWISGDGIETRETEEYSEAGRAVYPEGLYLLLKEAKARYSRPIVITENGIADSTDWIRPAYIAEHLAAVHRAIQEQVPITGYFQWTLADNLEWSDGYCPKFGLAQVLRNKNFKRKPRQSFFFFQEIAKTHTLTANQRSNSWKNYHTHTGQDRPYCRSENGKDALDQPRLRKIPSTDWRFK